MMPNGSRMTHKALGLLLVLAFPLGAQIACEEPPPGDAGGRRITSNVEDWRDEVIYQVMVDRFANGDYKKAKIFHWRHWSIRRLPRFPPLHIKWGRKP